VSLLTSSATTIMLRVVSVTRRKPSAVSAETHARVLEGAAKAFGELGYANVRVEDILAAADISRPTFYKLYASKEQVFEALSARHHREILKLVQSAAEEQQGGVARLFAIVDVFLRWRATLGPLGRVLDVEARTPGSSIADHRKGLMKRLGALAAKWLREEGRPAVDPVLVQSLIAATENVADALLGAGDADERTLLRAKQVALRIVAAALAGPEDIVPPAPPPPPARRH
jgi:AcrR family transcriptional regulator